MIHPIHALADWAAPLSSRLLRKLTRRSNVKRLWRAVARTEHPVVSIPFFHSVLCTLSHAVTAKWSEAFPIVHESILKTEPVTLEFLVQGLKAFRNARVSVLQQDPAFALWTIDRATILPLLHQDSHTLVCVERGVNGGGRR